MWFSLLLLAFAHAQTYTVLNQTLSYYTTYFIFNASQQIVDWVLVSATNTTLYVVGITVPGNVNESLCMPSETTRVTILSAGCSSTTRSQAVEDANCAPNYEDAISALAYLQENWDLPWDVDAPILYGQNSPLRFGPPRLAGFPPEVSYQVRSSFAKLLRG